MRSKLTETTQANLRAALEAGNTRAAAAQGAGITYETLRLWMRKGEKQAAGRHRALARTVEQAEAQAESEAVAEIRAAWKRGEWRAAAWWLERRRPEKYRDQKDQGSSAAAEETTIRIIYDAEVAKDLKPWTRSNNREQPDRPPTASEQKQAEMLRVQARQLTAKAAEPAPVTDADLPF